MGTVIKMYAATTGGDQSAVAEIDVPMPGHLVGVQWANTAFLAGADHFFVGQLSFRSAAAFTTNDDRGIISEIRHQRDLTTSGDTITNQNLYVMLPDVVVMGGERLYLHASATASVAGVLVCLLHFDFDLDKISMRRR